MRVIYDISVLGTGYYVPRARTGIFRVIENLAQELVKAQGISSFFTGERLYDFFQCLDYLQSNEKLQGVQVVKPDMNETVLDLMSSLYKIIHIKDTELLPFRVLFRVANILAVRTVSRNNIMNRDMLATADIYHSPFYPFPEQIKRSDKLKKIITIYDLIPVLFPEFFQNQENGLIHNVLKSIDNDTWVTCISRATKNDLCNYLPSLDPSRVIVTHLAASSLFYPCYDQAKIGEVKAKFGIHNGPYVLSLSTLEPRKNITQTIKCFSRLVEDESLNDLSLVLVGTKGWNFESIFNAIAANPKIRDQIVVAGYVDDEYLAPLYSGAMMFVYPSFYEGFGLPPLEAMQCGIPVITSNTSSLPEVVGEAGIMVDPEDGDTLCQAMYDIYKNSAFREELAVKSLERSKLFSWEKCAQQTVMAYKRALASR